MGSKGIQKDEASRPTCTLIDPLVVTKSRKAVLDIMPRNIIYSSKEITSGELSGIEDI